MIGEPGKSRDLRWFLICACIALTTAGSMQVLQWGNRRAGIEQVGSRPDRNSGHDSPGFDGLGSACFTSRFPRTWTGDLWLVWLYKIHAEMRNYTGGRYPISPGKAVGFCFIPFYNLYWMVYAPFKMAQNLETFLGEGTVQPNQVMVFQILSIVPGEFITGLGALFDALAMLKVQRGLNELWDRVRTAAAARTDVQIEGAARGGSA